MCVCVCVYRTENTYEEVAEAEDHARGEEADERVLDGAAGRLALAFRQAVVTLRVRVHVHVETVSRGDAFKTTAKASKGGMLTGGSVVGVYGSITSLERHA